MGTIACEDNFEISELHATHENSYGIVSWNLTFISEQPAFHNIYTVGTEELYTRRRIDALGMNERSQAAPTMYLWELPNTEITDIKAEYYVVWTFFSRKKRTTKK